MEHFIASLEAVLPIALMLGLGFLLMKMGMIKDEGAATMSRLSFTVFIPFLIFTTIASSDIRGALNLKLIIFGLIVTFALFLLLCLVVPLLERDSKRRGVLIQGILRSNFGIFGLPIAFELCRDGNIGSMPIMIAIFVPLFSALSIVGLELFRGEKIHPLRLTKTVLTNPLIVGAVAGILFLLLNIKLPTPIMSAVDSIAGLATPLALIVLGATFRINDLSYNKKQLAIGLIGKLIVVPLLILPIAIFAGFRDADLVCLLIMFAAPAAVSTFTIARQLDSDSALAGQLVVLGSLLSLVTIFVQIVVLKSFAFI